MSNNSDQYKKALDELNKLIKKQEVLNKTTDNLKDSWSLISSQIFALKGADFFKEIPLSVNEIKKLNDEISSIEGEVKKLEKAFSKALDSDKIISSNKKAFSGLYSRFSADVAGLSKDSSAYHQKETEFLDRIRKSRKELAGISDKDLLTIGEQVSKGFKMSDIYDNLDATSRRILTTNSDNASVFRDIETSITNAESESKGLYEQLQKGSREAFSLSAGLKKTFKDNVINEGLNSLMKFDQELNRLQKETGIRMDANSSKFADLTTQVSQFGMTTEDAGKMMQSMSEELKSTNFNELAGATKDFAAIEGATGASTENITSIAGELMRMGESSGQVKDYMQGASVMAQKFGISSKRAVEGIARNIKNIRQMGFVGGEESLQKMVMTAERLNMNIDEVFDVAKRARTIEGAMTMASELQLAGGSFSNINPMELLSAARNGPKELQKILTQMGSDIGHFSKETGKFEFDAVDVDRLQMVADATGQSMDSLQNMIQGNAESMKKTEMFKGITDSLGDLDAEMVNSGLSQMMKMEKDGTVKFDVDSDMAKRMGIDSMEELQSLSAEDLKAKMSADAKNLEEQNKQNQDFAAALKNFWTALQSLFHVFEPVLSVLTTVIQTVATAFQKVGDWVNSMGTLGTIIKWTVPLLMLFGTSFAASVLTFVTKGIKGFASNIKDLVLSKGKSLFSKGSVASDDENGVSSKAKGPSKDIGAGFKSLAEGLGAMGTTPGVLKGIGYVALSGPAFLLFTPALPGLLVLALIGKMGDSVKKGFTAIAEGLDAFGSAKSVLLGIGAVALAGASLLLFTPALPGILVMGLIGTMAESVKNGFNAVAEGIGAFGSNASIFAGIGAVALAGPALLLFTLALPALIGMGLIGLMAPLIESGFKAVANGLGAMGANLTGVLKGALALAVVGAAMIPFAFAASMMSEVNWLNVLAGVGVMALVVAGLIGLGMLAMFAGPLLIAGAAMLAVAGISMAIAAGGLMLMGNAFTQLQNINGSALLGVAMGMMALGPAMLSMSFGMMSFINPLALIGMMMMVYALGSLSNVMTPLSKSLALGSTSLNGFAIGIERLSAAAEMLSEDKLLKLQKLSEAMASASASGKNANAMAISAEKAGGKNSSSERMQKFEINLKINGRELQKIILDDTKIVK